VDILLHDAFVPRILLKYSQMAEVERVDDIKHPLVREALRLVGLEGIRLEIANTADIPAGTGLGSFGNFTTALLKALHVRKGVDLWEVIDAARTKPFGFQAFYPGPGLGGHCIPIDPFYRIWAARKHGVTTRFIELAGEVNTSMSAYVVSKVTDALNDRGKPVKGSKITLLGMAYKKDVDDPRESPGFELMELPLKKGGQRSRTTTLTSPRCRRCAITPA
jgi:UDP-glucose/GDP-mannose dehydrogenase family, central domain